MFDTIGLFLIILVSFLVGVFVQRTFPDPSNTYVAKILCGEDCYLRMRTAPTGIYLSGGVKMYFNIAAGDKLTFIPTHKDNDNSIEITILDKQVLPR